VVAVLFQSIARVQVSVFGFTTGSSEVANAEVDTRRFTAGGVGCLNFVFTDEVKFLPFRRDIVDGSIFL
jgi:hypothetical protein